MKSAFFAAVVLTGLSACSLPARVGTMERATVVPYHAVDWDPGHSVAGPVVSVLDTGDDLVVFEANRATVFVDGAIAGTETNAAGWSESSTIPAPDRSGEWLLGLDRSGKVHRLRARQGFEPVSTRFGLGGDRVSGAAAAGGPDAVFAVQGGFALSDGERVRRFAAKGNVRSVAGGAFTAAISTDDVVLAVDTRSGRTDTYEVEAKGIVVDSRGRLFVETERGLYATAPRCGDRAGCERPGSTGPFTLELVYSGKRLHGLARSGERVYFADESSVFVLEADRVSRVGGVVVESEARLVGSETGDVWTLSRAGKLARFARGEARNDRSPSDTPTYARDIGPMIAEDCGPCHAEAGETGIVLTGEAALRSRRDLVRQRVLVDGDMPPKSRPLSAADRALLERWLSTGAR